MLSSVSLLQFVCSQNIPAHLATSLTEVWTHLRPPRGHM